MESISNTWSPKLEAKDLRWESWAINTVTVRVTHKQIYLTVHPVFHVSKLEPAASSSIPNRTEDPSPPTQTSVPCKMDRLWRHWRRNHLDLSWWTQPRPGTRQRLPCQIPGQTWSALCLISLFFYHFRFCTFFPLLQNLQSHLHF